jgi:hypothetical protein
LAILEMILAAVVAYTMALDRFQRPYESRDLDWGVPAAGLGLIAGLTMVVSPQGTGPRLSIFYRVFEWIVWFVPAAIAISGAAVAVERVGPVGIPWGATACAGVGVFLLCLSFVRPMLARTSWWKHGIWSATGAMIGAFSIEVAWSLYLLSAMSGMRAGAGGGPDLVSVFEPAGFGLLLGGFLGFALSRVLEKRGK